MKKLISLILIIVVMTSNTTYAKAITYKDAKAKAEAVVKIVAENDQIKSSGTGFIISPDGKIATNYHVIQGATKITITFNDKTTYDKEFKILDYKLTENVDLAIIKINKDKLPYLKLGNSDKVKEKDMVYVIGSPRGKFNVVSFERILSRYIVKEKDIDSFYISYKNINFGASGSPLINIDGQVIGIVFKGDNKTGFAIPINYLKQLKQK